MSVEEKINDFTTNANLLANDYSPSKYVKLNVGGCLFQTTVGTLMKHDSMLRAMFSGRIEANFEKIILRILRK